MEIPNGCRKTDQGRGDSPQDTTHPKLTATELTLAAARKTRAGAGTSRLIPMPSTGPGPQMQEFMRQYQAAIRSYLAIPPLTQLPRINCPDDCGAAFRPTCTNQDLEQNTLVAKHDHECPQPSDHDLVVVTTIQALTGVGLTPDEIADDMELVVGWRRWSMNSSSLTGTGVGRRTPWLPNRPTMATCADTQCGGTESKCYTSRHDGGNSMGGPSCRIHAMANRNDIMAPVDVMVGSTFGMVALWGEVHSCERGFLATRAYPLTLNHGVLAEFYGVQALAKGDDDGEVQEVTERD